FTTQVPGEAVIVVGNPDLRPARGIRIQDNCLTGGGRGVFLIGALADVHITGNLVGNCAVAGLPIQDLAPSSRGLLLANNTMLRCGFAFRLWDYAPYKTYSHGQVELANNIFAEAHYGDLYFALAEKGDKNIHSGDGRALLKLWDIHH